MSSEEQATEAELTGRRAVRKYFIQPLEADGLVRKRGVSEEAHKAAMTKVAEKLGYCDRETLERLRPMILALAEGKSANLWPSLATIQNHAHALQAPPDVSDQVLYGWLHSRAGEFARRKGILLATRAYIKHFRRPPIAKDGERSFVFRKLQEKQRKIDLEIEGIHQRQSMQEAVPDELEWLSQQQEILAQLEVIVSDGIKRRAEKAAKEGANA